MFKKVLFSALLLLCNLLTIYTEESPYNILFINSYHSGFTWSDHIEQGVVDEFNNTHLHVNISFERMDSKRYSVEQVREDFIKRLEGKYPRDYFDLVLTSDDNAMNFAYEYRPQLFPDTPIIFSGVNNSDSPLLIEPEMMTGIIEYIDIEALIELIFKVHPKVEHLAIVTDSTNSGFIHLENTKRILDNKYSHIEYSEHKNWTLEELKKSLILLPGNTVIIELAFHLDKNGKNLSFVDERNFLKNDTIFPAYSLWDNRLNYGILGGVMTTGEVHGREAASLAIKLLTGEEVSEIPVLTDIELPIYYDYVEMKRFGISENQLPDKAIVINYPDTLWFRYREYLIGILIFIVFQSVIIILMVVNIQKRRVAERNLRVLNADLEHQVEKRTEELSHSLKELKETQNQLIETKKMSALAGMVSGIAHKLNTPLGICVTASSVIKDEIKGVHDSPLVDTVALLESNIKLVTTVIEDFRKVAVELNVEKIKSFNLLEHLENIVSSRKLGEVVVMIHCPGDIVLETYPGSIMRVLTILIDNSLVHGFTDVGIEPRIDIDVNELDKRVIILYRDNGKGINELDADKIFDPFYTTTFGKGQSGLGLNIAYNEVVHRLNGKIYVDDTTVQGLGVKIEIPI